MELYRHFKGDVYIVLHEATHIETGEKLVIYARADKSEREIWARPYKNFHGINEKGLQRFTKIDVAGDGNDR